MDNYLQNISSCVDWKVDPIWLGLFLVTLIDYFLGKTKKVESNSTLDLLLKGLWSLFKIILRRKK